MPDFRHGTVWTPIIGDTITGRTEFLHVHGGILVRTIVPGVGVAMVFIPAKEGYIDEPGQ